MRVQITNPYPFISVALMILGLVIVFYLPKKPTWYLVGFFVCIVFVDAVFL